MAIRSRVVGLLVLLGLCAPAAGEFGQPYFESVPGTDTIANGVVTALAQDSRGLIWFGTTDGLLSFDGYRLRHYRQDARAEDSLGNNYVRALLARPDGRLWVATQSAGLSIYDPARDAFEQIRADPDNPHGLANDNPVILADGHDGDVWIGFGIDGLDHWDASSGQFSHYRHYPDDPHSIAHDTVRSLLLDRRGDLWIGTANGLNRLRSGASQFESIASDPADPDSLAGQYVYSLYQADDGRVWIGTQADGAAVLEPESLRFQRFAAGDGEPDHPGLSHPWVDGFAEPQPGQIWVATFGGGIDVLDSESGTVLDRIRNDPAAPGSLALDRVVAPLRDRFGLIWVGTWGGGLQHHNPSNAATFRTLRHSPNRANGLSHNTVLSVLELEEGRLWIGTGGNGIDVIDRQAGRISSYPPDPNRPGALRDGTVRALARSNDGSRWVGTQQAGLMRFDAGTEQFRSVPLGQPDQRIRRLLPGPEGELWVGTQRGLARLDPASEAVEFQTLADGSPFNDAVWSLALDGAGNLWVGTPDRLLRRDRRSAMLEDLSAGEMQAPGAVMDLWRDPNDHIWAVGPGGLQRLEGADDGPQRFTSWGRDLQTLDPSYGRQLLGDAQGRLWTPRFLIDPERYQVRTIGRAEGVDIGNVEMGASAATDDGLLVFGGTRGLLLIDPGKFRPWPHQAPLLITSLQVDGIAQQEARHAHELVIQPGQVRITIGFAALDYAAPDQVQYAYRLEGLDQQWIETDAERRDVSYNNLWPGHYELQLRARGHAGDWSTEPLRLPILVLPAWWQTWWFATCMVVLLIAMVFAALRWRTARILQRSVQLQHLVNERTLQLSQSKAHAEQALQELQNTQKQLVAAEKMASLGQLVAGVAHEINTPIGIAVTAMSHLQDSTRESSEKMQQGALTRRDLQHWQVTVEEATRLVLGSLERASTLITSFKRVSVDQSSEQRRRLSLNAFLLEVQVALQPSFRCTRHALTIDCPDDIDMDTFPGALFQILTNLINNAVLHAFAEDQAGQMRIHAEQHGQRVRLCFSDDGVGMSDVVATHAFDPFYTTRRGSGGSGLGLHLVHNLTTQLLGGHIELHSQPGAGAEFVMDLPRVAPS